jgi:DNA-binding GntR family transcriptional regulator
MPKCMQNGTQKPTFTSYSSHRPTHAQLPMSADDSLSTAESPEILVQDVDEKIKDAILANRLRPGTKLTYIALAESLGVSRTPVRESLERLYQEGYVTRIVNRGFFVAEIDAHELRDLYQTREALEVYALRRVIEGGLSALSATRGTRKDHS